MVAIVGEGGGGPENAGANAVVRQAATGGVNSSLHPVVVTSLVTAVRAVVGVSAGVTAGRPKCLSACAVSVTRAGVSESARVHDFVQKTFPRTAWRLDAALVAANRDPSIVM